MAIRTKEFYKRQNRILEKLAKTDLSPDQAKYCFALFRKTFGYGKYEDSISRVQFKGLTGILEVNISRVRRRLKERNIIHKDAIREGFNLNTGIWETVSGLILSETVSGLIPDSINQSEKKGIRADTYKELTKKSPKKGGGVLEIRRSKEINKMEGKEWLRAMMIEIQGYSEKFTDKFLSKEEFTPCYDAWFELQEAMNVRDREAWLLAKLERGPVPEE